MKEGKVARGRIVDPGPEKPLHPGSELRGFNCLLSFSTFHGHRYFSLRWTAADNRLQILVGKISFSSLPRSVTKQGP